MCTIVFTKGGEDAAMTLAHSLILSCPHILIPSPTHSVVPSPSSLPHSLTSHILHPHILTHSYHHPLTPSHLTSSTLTSSQEIVVGSNMDKIYIVMDYVEHDLKALMETMQTNFLESKV